MWGVCTKYADGRLLTVKYHTNKIIYYVFTYVRIQTLPLKKQI